MAKKGLDPNPDANRDPITGQPGSHPVGTATGAAVGGVAGGLAGGAFAGAAAGAAAGPVGAAIGAGVGAIAGAAAGHSVAERIDPTVEDRYWRDNYTSRPYIASGSTYDDYGPAYRYGYETYPKYHGRNWNAVETEMERDWERVKGKSRLNWEKAKLATRDAFERVSDTLERATPGDSDRDGR